MKVMNNNFEKAIQLLQEGRAIIIPTDTVYGLAAIPTKEAINLLYTLKKKR